MCCAEALALSLLMLARCRIWLLCDPVGAVAAGALAAGTDWSVCAIAGREVKATTAPRPIRAIVLSIECFSIRGSFRPRLAP